MQQDKLMGDPVLEILGIVMSFFTDNTKIRQ